MNCVNYMDFYSSMRCYNVVLNFFIFVSLYISRVPEQNIVIGRTHGAPYRGYGYVPLRFGGNVVRRMGTQQQQNITKIYRKLNVKLKLSRVT